MHYMKGLRFVVCLSAAVVVTLVSLGCGGNYIPPLASVNPTKNSLVAQYTIRRFHSGLRAWVEFGTDTTYGRQTSVVTDSMTNPGGEGLEILVAGMKPQTTYHMRAHANWTGGSWVDQDQTFTTGALPAGLTLPGISVTQPTLALSPAPGVELLSLIGPQQTVLECVITDLQGNIIWFYPDGPSLPIKQMSNGHVLLQLGGDLREVDLATNTIRDVTLAQVNQSLQQNGYSFSVINFSHDVLVLPNGHWITIGQISKDF